MTSPKVASIICALFLVPGSFVAIPKLLAYADEDSIGRGPDSDADGLSDSFEARLGTNPDLPDSDSDGLTDGLEYTGGNSGVPTDPVDSDTDNDGLTDGFEISHGIDPSDIDTDNDGLADSFEVSSGTNPTQRDSDGDGLSDSLEVSHDTNPLLADTDEDGVADNIEVWHGSDPQNPQSFFVLPESPIGPVMLMIASMAALGGFIFFRSRQSSTNT